MKSFTLIYFNGCPNYELASKLLRQAGIEFTKVCQNTIGESDPHKKYSSPTLLMNAQVIFGSKVSSTGGGRSLKLPSKSEILDIIKTQIPET